MAKKTIVSEAADSAKTIAGAALGAAAVAATGVLVRTAAGALRRSGEKLEGAAPDIQQKAAQTVMKPLAPKKQKRAAATRKTKSARKKVAARKSTGAARKGRRSARRKR